MSGMQAQGLFLGISLFLLAQALKNIRLTIKLNNLIFFIDYPLGFDFHHCL